MKRDLTVEEQNALRIEVAKLRGWQFKPEGSSEGEYVVFSHPDEVGVMRYFPSGSPEDTKARLHVGGVPDYLNDLDECAAFRSEFNTGQAIRFVQELSRILGEDQNAPSAWEMYCTRDAQKAYHGIFFFIHASAEQQCRALLNMALPEHR